MRFYFLLITFLLSGIHSGFATSSDSISDPRRQEYQIHLSRPARLIRLLLDDRSMMPVRGRISEDKKSVILPEYEKGQRIRLKVEYEDGTVEELIKSPCFIDPVVTLPPARQTGRTPLHG